jgi:hypothetical protein
MEVAGDGTTVAVDAHSAQDIAAGLRTLLADEALVAQLRVRGLKRAGEFSWDKSAAETCRIYHEVLDDQPSAVRLYATR